MGAETYQSRQTQEIIKYVHEKYGDELEFLWQKFSNNSIWRNKVNQKWYAVLLVVAKNKLGIESDEKAEIIDLRFDKHEALEFVSSNENVYPGYHMNKNNWITIILDGGMPTQQICELIDHSYNLSLAG